MWLLHYLKYKNNLLLLENPQCCSLVFKKEGGLVGGVLFFIVIFLWIFLVCFTIKLANRKARLCS